MIPVDDVYTEAQWRHRISRKTIRYYLSKRLLPPTTKVGRCMYYKNKDKIIFLIGLVRDMQKAGITTDSIRVAMRHVTDEGE